MQTFGEYLRMKRIDKGLSLRRMAEKMQFSPTYWSDIENGRRNPPSYDKLMAICEVLTLSTEESELLFDLAGDFEQMPPPDLTEYLRDPSVKRALRTAKKNSVNSQAWEEFERSINPDHANK